MQQKKLYSVPFDHPNNPERSTCANFPAWGAGSERLADYSEVIQHLAEGRWRGCSPESWRACGHHLLTADAAPASGLLWSTGFPSSLLRTVGPQAPSTGLPRATVCTGHHFPHSITFLLLRLGRGEGEPRSSHLSAQLPGRVGKHIDLWPKRRRRTQGRSRGRGRWAIGDRTETPDMLLLKERPSEDSEVAAAREPRREASGKPDFDLGLPVCRTVRKYISAV